MSIKLFSYSKFYRLRVPEVGAPYRTLVYRVTDNLSARFFYVQRFPSGWVAERQIIGGARLETKPMRTRHEACMALAALFDTELLHNEATGEQA